MVKSYLKHIQKVGIEKFNENLFNERIKEYLTVIKLNEVLPLFSNKSYCDIYEEYQTLLNDIEKLEAKRDREIFNEEEQALTEYEQEHLNELLAKKDQMLQEYSFLAPPSNQDIQDPILYLKSTFNISEDDILNYKKENYIELRKCLYSVEKQLELQYNDILNNTETFKEYNQQIKSLIPKPE